MAKKLSAAQVRFLRTVEGVGEAGYSNLVVEGRTERSLLRVGLVEPQHLRVFLTDAGRAALAQIDAGVES